jgi:hypothetical protein
VSFEKQIIVSSTLIRALAYCNACDVVVNSKAVIGLDPALMRMVQQPLHNYTGLFFYLAQFFYIVEMYLQNLGLVYSNVEKVFKYNFVANAFISPFRHTHKQCILSHFIHNSTATYVPLK